ncbi:MAG TPA: NUDIX hydrolase [Actinomycetota bacterium]|nr:NUDIX hydrolase [Actinomycetota bacterium]
MKTRRQVSAGGVLVRVGPHGPEVLLASRRTRRGDLVWGLPKGLVEPGEAPEETAVREVLEETGHRGTVRRPLQEISYWFVWEGTRIRKTVHFFLMDASDEAPGPRDREMEEIRWFPLEEAADVAGFDSEKKVILEAAQAVAG